MTRPVTRGAAGLTARLVVVASVAGALFTGPALALGHSLDVTYQSRLPLVVYLIGAGLAVALSFAFVLLADVRADPPPASEGRLPPAPIRVGLRTVGLVGWAWIVAQGLIGGTSAGDVSSLFLWVYGWVGLAIVSALVGPVWHFLDPFATLHDIGARALRAVGVGAWEPADYPVWLGRWPAVVGLVFFVWLELVGDGGGPGSLFIVLVGYTAFTLAMMAQFGKDAWRRSGETFSVWFGLLNRVAPFALVDADGRVRRRPYASGLLEPGWVTADIVLVAVGTGSILYDGLSQTTPWFGVFGTPSVAAETLILVAFLGIIAAAALAVSRLVGIGATGAGLLPIAVGYLVAHYFTYLLIDGQRLLVAIADPLQLGWDVGGLGWAFFEPGGDFLPPGLVWTVQIAAVVGGHMLGAWGGHVVAAASPGVADAAGEAGAGAHRRRQVPLAVVMVALTTLTLWSLGQSLVVEQPEEVTLAAVEAPGGER